MTLQLTPKKQKILDYLKQFINNKGYSPSIVEIAKKFQLSSVATVHQHLDELEKMHLIRRQHNKVRAISLLQNNTTEDEAYYENQTVSLPVLGLITAGSPIEAVEDRSEMLSVPKELASNPNSYILKVKGDSMIESLIADGDYIVVQKRDYANNGDIIVALLEDGTATLKEFHREKKYIRLQPRNKNYKPLLVKNVIIQGKVAGIIRKF